MVKILEKVWSDIKHGKNLDLYVTIIVAVCIVVAGLLEMVSQTTFLSVLLAVFVVLVVDALKRRSDFEAVHKIDNINQSEENKMPYDRYEPHKKVFIKFRGRARLYGKESALIAYKTKIEKSVVNLLNQQSTTISQEIEDRITQFLPPLVTVKAQIKFEKGSIVWSGRIIIFALSTVADIIGVIQFTREALEWIVDQTAHHWIYETGLVSDYIIHTSTNLEVFYSRAQLQRPFVSLPIHMTNLVRFVLLNFWISVAILGLLFFHFYYSKLILFLKSIGFGSP